MKPIRILLAITFAGLTTITQAQDPLASWNDGKAKQSITDFVAKVGLGSSRRRNRNEAFSKMK